jgi:hypothetical protein
MDDSQKVSVDFIKHYLLKPEEPFHEEDFEGFLDKENHLEDEFDDLSEEY